MDRRSIFERNYQLLIPQDVSIQVPFGFGSSRSLSNIATSNERENSVSVLSNQLMDAYQDQAFSDFQLCCGDSSFPVHKVILAARSPVFKSMLTNNMKETASSSAVIEDLDPQTLGIFLAFLYTGTIKDLLRPDALKLYYAADKYQVPSLKKECSAVLKGGITDANVFDVLSLADRHGDDELMSVVIDFFGKNYDSIFSSKEWKCFMAKDPLLLCKTLTASAEKKARQKHVRVANYPELFPDENPQ